MAAKRSSQGGGLSSLVREAAQKAKQAVSSADAVDNSRVITVKVGGEQWTMFGIMDYIEQPWGLNWGPNSVNRLYPVQKFIVKLYYHIPLDDKEKTITITDKFREKTLYHFTEKEYLEYLYNEGRCNIKEQDHPRNELVLSIGRRSGKCVKWDTLVPTSKGIFRIEDLGHAPEDEFTPASIRIAQESGRRAEATAFYNGGVKPTYTVRTKSGYFVTGTGNHRVKVMAPSGKVEWRYLDEIREGDFVAINRSSDLWATEPVDLRPYHNSNGVKQVNLPDVLDEKWANLLGYLVGDGTWGDSHAVSLTVAHHETWAHVTNLFRDLVGEPRIQMKNGTTGRLEFCSVRVRQFLDAIGWKLGCDRYSKMVPWVILRSPKPIVCAFLRGLFETDGCVENGGSRITFSSASFRLASEVQLLLLNMGIVSSVRKKWNKKTKRHYANLSIKGVRSRRLFAELIGFDSEKKNSPLLEALRTAKEGKSDTESVPHQYSRIRDLLESVPRVRPVPNKPQDWKRSRLREILGNTCKPSSGEDISYSRMQKLVEVAKEVGADPNCIAHFEEILQLDYYYDEVESVTEGEDQVYDLSVPEGHAFVANGFTNHNSTLASIFASYEIYRLLNLYSPQEYYGLPPGERINLVSIGADKDQAGILFNMVQGHLMQCEYFKPYLAVEKTSEISFRTPADIAKYGETRYTGSDGKHRIFHGKPTIRVTFKSCIAKGLRGYGNAVVILDEMAHYQSQGQASAKEIYDAITPATAAYSPKDPVTKEPIGPVESRIINISSPLNKEGKFYELFNQAMANGPESRNLLALQCPTWEVNPTIPGQYFLQKYHEDPAVFMVEFGAQFSDQIRGWIEREEDLMACIDPELRPRLRGLPRVPHFMGIDLALSGDGTAIVITTEENGKITVVYHELWQAGVDWRVSNPHLGDNYPTDYAKTLKDVVRLDFDEIANWIEALTKRFYIEAGLFDQWNGITLEQALHKKGLTQFRMERFLPEFQSRIYQNAKLLMFDEQLRMYDWPIPERGSRHSAFISELLSLQAEQKAKNIVNVRAPQTAGMHDDLSDAWARSIWLASERRANTKYAAGAASRPYVGMPASSMTPGRYQMLRALNRGWFTERTIPRNLGLRRYR